MGIWTIVPLGPSEATAWNSVVAALGVLLVLASIGTVIGPKRIFYASAFLSGAQATVFLLALNLTNFFTLFSAGLCALTLVISLFAARWEVRVSEQSHPMNLPVFG